MLILLVKNWSRKKFCRPKLVQNWQEKFFFVRTKLGQAFSNNLFWTNSGPKLDYLILHGDISTKNHQKKFPQLSSGIVFMNVTTTITHPSEIY